MQPNISSEKLFSGWLQKHNKKRSFMKSNTKKRWCVLERVGGVSEFKCYTSQSCSHLRASFTLTTSTLCVQLTSAESLAQVRIQLPHTGLFQLP